MIARAALRALRARIRKVKSACLLLATNLYPRFKEAYSLVKYLLSMDIVTNWLQVEQAEEWEAKVDFLKELEVSGISRNGRPYYYAAVAS